MLIVLSPAKSLDYASPVTSAVQTRPEFMQRAAQLVAILRTLAPAELASLMKISDPLAQLNAQRYHDWSSRVSGRNAKPAVLAFDGDVYDGLQACSMTPVQLDYLQSHLRILSGLYGVIRPLDMMQPYRLEMGTRLANAEGADLYAFWGDTVAKTVQAAMKSHRDKTVINLASEEYFRVLRQPLGKAKVVSPVFEDWKGGQYKVISFFAKRARGAMARYAAEHAVKQPERLQQFDLGGYRFDADASDASTWRFRRKIVA